MPLPGAKLFKVSYRTDTFNTQSPTAVICDKAPLYGATPEAGEHDPRGIWDRDDAIVCTRCIIDFFGGRPATLGSSQRARAKGRHAHRSSEQKRSR